MTIRLATSLDATRWRDMQAAFFASAGLEFRVPTLTRLRARFRQPNIIAIVDENGICEVKVSEHGREIRVELLLPQGQDRKFLFPVLAGAIVETARRYPAALDWRVWAAFIAGNDAADLPDGGRGECLAWQEFFPDSDVAEDGGGWYIESTLRRLLATQRPTGVR